jgi:hypothetical protein
MRTFKKYKSWSKIKGGSFFPLRILKFKKTKWKKTKKNLLRIKSSSFFFDHTTDVIQTKTWGRIKSYYKNKILFALNLKQRYDYKPQNQTLFSHQKDFYLKNYIENEYRVDLLLYTLNFFSSIYEARQHIKNGFVLINNRINRSDRLIMSKGDILVVLRRKNKLPQRVKKEFKFSFLEVDYYTQTIVILKNLNSLNFQDVLYNFTEKN